MWFLRGTHHSHSTAKVQQQHACTHTCTTFSQTPFCFCSIQSTVSTTNPLLKFFFVDLNLIEFKCEHQILIIKSSYIILNFCLTFHIFIRVWLNSNSREMLRKKDNEIAKKTQMRELWLKIDWILTILTWLLLIITYYLFILIRGTVVRISSEPLIKIKCNH